MMRMDCWNCKYGYNKRDKQYRDRLKHAFFLFVPFHYAAKLHKTILPCNTINLIIAYFKFSKVFYVMQQSCATFVPMKSLLKSGRLDQVGIGASIACAVHCAALPILATSLPLTGLSFLANTWVEIVMILFSALIGTLSIAGTYTKHRNGMPIALLLSGFLLIATGHFAWHEMESWLIPLGGFTIAAAHFINWKMVNVCYTRGAV